MLLSKEMTLAQYRDYLINRPDYQAYCSVLYKTAARSTTIPLCFTMAFLLGGATNAKSASPAQRIFSQIVDYENTTWAPNMRRFLVPDNRKSQADGGKTPKGDGIQSYLNNLFSNWDTQDTITNALKKLPDAVDAYQNNAIWAPTHAKQVEQWVDALFTACVEDRIMDQIHVGGCRQIIFTGAPGTGKTYSAKNIAAIACSGSDSWGAGLPCSGTEEPEPYTLVQFHPSYDYTDFVEGLRPVPAVDTPAQKIEITSRCDYQNLMNGLRDAMSQNAPAQPVLVENRFDCTALLSGLQSVMNAGQVRFAKVDGTFKAFCRKVVAQNELSYQSHVDEIRKSISAHEAMLEKCDVSEETLETIYNFISGLPKYFYKEDTDHVRALIKSAETSLSAILVRPAVQHLEQLLADQTAFPAAATLQNLPTIEQWIAEAEDLLPRLPEEPYGACKDLIPQLTAAKKELIFNHLLNLLKNNDQTAALQVFTDHEAFLQQQYKPRFFSYLKGAADGDSTKTEKVLKTPAGSPQKNVTSAVNIISDLEAALSKDTLADSAQVLQELRKVLRTLSEELAKNPNKLLDPEKEDSDLYFFIIDEINRANLSKVFGELMYCLEKDKRGKKHAIQTQYQNLPTYDLEKKTLLTEENDCFYHGFYIPQNVVVIGTMNDIDRSVDSMDFALRRRFEWKEFVVEPSLLTKAFKSGNYGDVIAESADTLAACIGKLNEHLLEKGKHYGLNRQYFISQGQFSNLPANLKNKKDILKYVWEYRIESLLREYLRGEDEEKIDEFVGSYDEMTGACKALFSALADDTGDKEKNDDDSDETSGTTPPDGAGADQK